MRPVKLWLLMIALLAGCATRPAPTLTSEGLRQQVVDTERAFAKTMADRDFAAFNTFIADDAVFFSDTKALRGKQQVADAWQRLYQGANPPFSWTPEQVEVLAAGNLALSTGPVRDRAGKLVATFTSIWRAESPGVWRIVFDKGNDVCDCAAK